MKWMIQIWGGKMISKLVNSLDGIKTYITLVIGILVAFIGAAWGPIDMPGSLTDVPKLEWAEFWNILWMALSGIFLRSGVAKK